MTKFLTAAAVLVFAVSMTVSAAPQSEKKVRKVVKTETAHNGAWLGVGLGNISMRPSDDEKSNVKQGAVISEVMDDSPADSVGLKEDDVIIELNGKAVSKADDVVKGVQAMKPGEKATITVMRDDTKKTFTAVLGAHPIERRHMEIRTAPSAPGMPMAPMMNFRFGTGVEGMQLMELHDQLGRYFEAPDGKALLVTEVKKNSMAHKAGIQAGDVITKVGTTDIEDVGDLHQALRQAKEGSQVDVAIIRKGAHKTVKLEVSAPEEHRMMMNFGNGFPGMQPFNFNFDREQLRDMIKNLKPEIDKIKKEIRIHKNGEEADDPSCLEEECECESGTSL